MVHGYPLVRDSGELIAAGCEREVQLVDGPAAGRPLPPESVRRSLRPSDVVKVGVIPTEPGGTETHLWAEVETAREGGRYTGRVSQWSTCWEKHGLSYGSPLDFGPEHVLDLAGYEWPMEEAAHLQRCRHCSSSYTPIRPGCTTCVECIFVVTHEWRLLVRECLGLVMGLDQHQVELRYRLHQHDPEVVGRIMYDLLAHRSDRPEATAEEILDVASECGIRGFHLDRLDPLGLDHGDEEARRPPGFHDLNAVRRRATAGDQVAVNPGSQGDPAEAPTEPPAGTTRAAEDEADLGKTNREFDRLVGRRGGAV